MYRILDRLFNSLPRRQQHLVNEATLKARPCCILRR